MQSASTFHLEWSNHLGNMQAVLESLYMHQSLVDVTIACRDGILKAHKVILSACSPYFEAVFQETPCKHPVLILKGVSVREMQALLRFMYRGQVDVPEADLNTLVATACEFKVKGFAVDVMRGADDSRPASPSEHDSENEVNDGGRNTSSRGWKKSDKNDGIKNVSQEGIVSDVNEEMSVTPVIVESQSLKEPLSEAKSEEEDNEKEEKKQKNEEEGHDDKPSASQKSSEEAEPAAEGAAAASVISSSGSGNSGPANGNAGENTPFRRETRYKGQKRVDVGLGRPAIVRPRSVDKRESSSSGIELRHSTQPVKKQRMLTVTRKVEHSADSDHAVEDQGSDQTEEKNMTREPGVPDMTISACPSEDGPMQFVRIKAEAESAEEEEEEEATADMFCIPHLQELPEGDADGTGGPSTASEMVLAGGWAQPEAMVPPSGREQRAVAAETGTEEGEGDMACPYCFTRCSKFSDLKRHMRLHTEDKPHECEFCSLAFARASHLARHRRTHTGERPFRCPAPACERTFSRQDKLKLHTQRAHPGLPCEAVQGGSFMRIRGRRRVRDKALPLGLRLGLAPPRGGLPGPGRSSTTLPARTTTLGPAVISLPFGDTSYLTSLSLGQQRYSDLTISPVMAPSSTGGGAGPGVGGPVGGAEDLLKSVRQLGECTIQTLPSKVLAE